MGRLTVETCEIEGLKIITPEVRWDERGFFMESYQYEDFKAAGIDQVFVQDNQSSSVRGVLRGLHFQIQYPQDKLVRVLQGEVYDVAVDIRKGSATYGNGTAYCFLRKIRSSFSFRRILHTVFLFYPIMRNLPINVRIFIIPTTRPVSCGTIRISVLTGRSAIWS